MIEPKIGAEICHCVLRHAKANEKYVKKLQY